MNHFSFTSFLTSNLKLDDHELTSIIDGCSTRLVNKNDFLLKHGQHCKLTFFVEKGLLKQYTIDNKGKEHILYFAPESWFISDRASIFFNQPSPYFIQALEDCQLRILDEKFMMELSQRIPNFTEFNNRLLHNHIRQLQNRVSQLLGATAEERYIQFIELYPDITLRVPQTLIASYLGITPESLSRVRRDLARRHQ